MCAASARAQFVPVDSVVSDPNISMPDPEFDHSDYRLTYRDDLNRLWVGRIDPQNGAFTPKSGQGVLVDTVAWNGQVNGIGNGPEWGYSQNGAEIYYTDLISGLPALAKAVPFNNDWFHNELPSARNRALPIASVDSTFPNACITYLVVSGSTGTPAWRIESNPSSEHPLPTDGSGGGGRWILGQRAFTLAIVDTVTGYRQAAKYIIDTNTYQILTHDPGDKSEIWMWKAPEFGNVYVLACINDSTGMLNVYKETIPGNGDWEAFYTVTPPSRYQYILSPEPFTFDGRSYLFLQMSETPTQENANADIWIATVDPALPFYRQVSDTMVLKRRDPEFYILQSGPVIYYTEVRGSGAGTKVIHRCATGLTLYPPYVGVREDLPRPHATLALASTNPVLDRAAIAYTIDARAPVSLEVFDVHGRRIARVVEAEQDAGTYTVSWDTRDVARRRVPAGVYLLQLRAGATRASFHVVVRR